MSHLGRNRVKQSYESKRFLSGICDCSVDSDAGTGEILLVSGVLYVYGHAHVPSHVSTNMD